MAENTNAANGGESKKKRNFGPKEPVTVSVSQILTWLEEGETRTDIAAKLGLNIGQVNALFSSSDKLKGKKTKKDLSKSFHLIDDTSNVAAPPSTNGAGTGTENVVPQEAQTAPSWD